MSLAAAVPGVAPTLKRPGESVEAAAVRPWSSRPTRERPGASPGSILVASRRVSMEPGPWGRPYAAPTARTQLGGPSCRQRGRRRSGKRAHVAVVEWGPSRTGRPGSLSTSAASLYGVHDVRCARQYGSAAARGSRGSLACWRRLDDTACISRLPIDYRSRKASCQPLRWPDSAPTS